MRLNVIGKLEALQQIVGVDAIVNVLVPEIVSLADDAQVISDPEPFRPNRFVPFVANV